MRVNIYAEEMTDRVEIISKEVEGRKFTAVRFYLELPASTWRGDVGHPVGAYDNDEKEHAANVIQVRGPFIHRPGDDDSAAVTFWGKRDLRPMLLKALALLDEHYGTPTTRAGAHAFVKCRRKRGCRCGWPVLKSCHFPSCGQPESAPCHTRGGAPEVMSKSRLKRLLACGVTGPVVGETAAADTHEFVGQCDDEHCQDDLEPHEECQGLKALEGGTMARCRAPESAPCHAHAFEECVGRRCPDRVSDGAKHQWCHAPACCQPRSAAVHRGGGGR